MPSWKFSIFNLSFAFSSKREHFVNFKPQAEGDTKISNDNSKCKLIIMKTNNEPIISGKTSKLPLSTTHCYVMYIKRKALVHFVP